MSGGGGFRNLERATFAAATLTGASFHGANLNRVKGFIPPEPG